MKIIPMFPVSRIPLYQKNIMTIHKYILKNDLLLGLLQKDEMDLAGVIVQPQHTGGPGIS
ncbi:MAG: hypothetical protein R2875_00500 [Desulfobacterales bacterium]